MNLEKHYTHLYEEAIHKITLDQNFKDSWLDNPNDNRYGITLLARPDPNCIQSIQSFLNQLRIIEPEQYYYPSSDIHLTVMSLISCYPGFELERVNVSDYVKLVGESLKGIKPFNIKLEGITASPSCIMVQGFPSNGRLKQIRDQLRQQFNNGNLEHTIDKRYSLQTAHNTVTRFKSTIQNKGEFLDLLHRYRYFDFGTFEINSMELVFNDWYQLKNKVKVLHRYSLD
ncbi:mutarotase [Echinicola jeungdonensis]|uniref:2'-5' RNA ligase family protein n=1 Tax=Echinicola jeungdonensis TaxID=709343 RepID=A0ABV5J994_9BACT|nr:mutarotase [Echinicola jeungdonensis]MDN3670499.1 mutarotase [Echinicola jeungdonensis]